MYFCLENMSFFLYYYTLLASAMFGAIKKVDIIKGIYKRQLFVNHS